MNLAACQVLLRRPLSGTWYRALELQFLKSPLGTKHTRTSEGRFNPGSQVKHSFAVLYCSENQVVALQEVEAVYGKLVPGQIVPNPHRPTAVINLDAQLGTVVDLTEPSQWQPLDVSLQLLTGNWSWYNARRFLAPTQELGLALFNEGDVEGFLAPSAKSPEDKSLIIFPARLRKGSAIRYRDPATGKPYTLKGK